MNKRRFVVSPIVLLVAILTAVGFGGPSAAATGGLETRVRAIDTPTATVVRAENSESPASVGHLRQVSAAIASATGVATNTVNPRDVHGELADTDVDVDHVKSEGDLYIQDDGQLVRVLDNGNGTSDVVVYDPSNPTCAPTTKIKNMPNRQVQSRIDSGRWS